eukprot:6046084-Prymnesium_polylepis.1
MSADFGTCDTSGGTARQREGARFLTVRQCYWQVGIGCTWTVNSRRAKPTVSFLFHRSTFLTARRQRPLPKTAAAFKKGVLLLSSYFCFLRTNSREGLHDGCQR